MFPNMDSTYLQNISIKNYRGIPDLKLFFPDGPGIVMLLGDNGVGKTSILQAISTGLSGYLQGIKGSSPKNILMQDVRIHTEQIGGASTAIVRVTPVKITCRATIHNEVFEWERIREWEEGSQAIPTATLFSSTKSSLKSFARRMSNDPFTVLPILRYLPTDRLFVAEKLTDDDSPQLKYQKKEEKLVDRCNGYAGCFRNTIDRSLINAWILKMDMEQYFRGQEIPEYKAFKKIIGSFMAIMVNRKQPPQLYYSRQFRSIVYEENGQPLPISYLSAGYQSLLWIVMDIAFRMAFLNPHLGEALHMTPGIVMIDELDMHLHPKWQWNVLKALRDTFPNVQFIVATHSPILVSSCKNGHIIRIDENHDVTYSESPYASTIDNVVELVQGSTSVPDQVKALQTRFDRAINAGNYDYAKQILNEMKEQFGETNRAVQLASAELSMDFSIFNED